MEAGVDPRFGRAAKFVVVDLDTGAVESIDNAQNVNAAQGAGIQAAQNVANLGVGALITGHCGPKAFRVLSAAGVKIHAGASGTVAEAVEKYKKGELTELDSADVEGHWV
jgi:predicted Fe-Mo cluster-binding NifX family protein